MTIPLGRRAFLTTGASAIAGVLACSRASEPLPPPAVDQIGSRPGSPTTVLAPGKYSLGIGSSRFPGILPSRDAILYVPHGHNPAVPIPLVVLLHGGSGAASNWFDGWETYAESYQVALLAPDSRDYTWDLIADGAYGVDVRFIDAALAWTFDRMRVDAQRIALVGFSDGGSYAVSLGITNGDTFSRLIAFSACTLAPGTLRGKPQAFVAHGLHDPVFPIESCGRPIVSELRSHGYTVQSLEFDGRHELPLDVTTAALDWLAASWK